LPLGLDELAENDLVLPDELIPEMRNPLGKFLEGEDPDFEVQVKNLLVTVGDQCTLNLIKGGHRPDLAIVDYKTKRMDIGTSPEIEGFGKVVMKLANPAGRISRDAWSVLKDAFDAQNEVRVDVEGEEDLLALPSILLAPEGSAVVYGLPSKGIVVVDVENGIRQRVLALVKRMVVKHGN
jgi:uncharacterized protein (UPF0218 family)